VGASLDKGLKGAQKELAATAKEAAVLDSTLGKGLNKASNTAGQSLTNLGRIAQDAPFGFIGIQNNINPLLESFQRLKVETGSTGGALKALAGSLIGAGGIGLAVSVATGLLTVLAQQGFFTTEKAADSAAEANKKYKESLEGIFTDVAKEVTQVNTLIAVLNSETETRQRKLAALKELRQISPEIFNGLKLEEGAVIGLDNAYQNYIKNIKTVIAVKQKQAQIEAIIAKILKLEGAEQTNQAKALDKSAKEIRNLVGQGINQSQLFTTTIKELSDQKELRLLNRDLESFVSQLTELSSGVKLKIDPDKEVKKTTKDLETVSSTLQNLAKEIQFLNSVQLTFGTDESAAKIKAIEAAINTLLKDFDVKPEDSIIQKLLTGGKLVNIVQGLNIPGIKGLTKDVGELIETEAATGPTPTVTVPVNVQAAIDKIDVGKIVGPDSEFTAQVEEITDRLRQTVANSFASIFEGIGAGVSAQGIFANFFKTIFTELGAGIQQLGIQSAAVQNLLKALRASFGKPPGIAAAIGLIALGGIIKGLASRIQVPAFATGGTAPGGSILVGERGPEIITAPRGATITPNAQTNAMLSGAGGGTVVFRIQGRELVGVLNNTNATLGRNGQG
jgi:ribosome-binding factor A